VLARLAAPEGADALAAAAAVLDAAGAGPDAGGTTGASGLVPGESRRADDPSPMTLAAAVRRLVRPATLEGLEAAYQALFGHTARGAVPPYETEYGADSLFQPMHEMADLAAFYRAFGLGLGPGSRERPDHVACECEFLAFLLRKEAYAGVREDTSMLEATRAAIRRFLRDHVGRWGPGFGRALGRRDPEGFYGALGGLCALFVARECARSGVAAGPDLLRLRAADLSATPAACAGAAPACAPDMAPP
jgi:TorA maturation chaperone TorD